MKAVDETHVGAVLHQSVSPSATLVPCGVLLCRSTRHVVTTPSPKHQTVHVTYGGLAASASLRRIVARQKSTRMVCNMLLSCVC